MIGVKNWLCFARYFLLNDTIENNIKFYNDLITREEMENAAKMANIYNFIQELPQNLILWWRKGNSSIRRTKTKNNIGKSIGKKT